MSATLSLNWKKLSSKINQGSKVTKKSTKERTGKNKIKKAEVEKSLSITPTVPKSKLSPIELALWTKENEIEISDIPLQTGAITLVPQGNDSRKKEPGKYLAMDCEFVGVGPEGTESALARVSIVNFYGHTILDKFVKPREKVTDWRTWVSGVTPKHMNEAISFQEAQNETSKLLEGRILVGHAIHHDLDALFLSHPKSKIRDTSQYKPFRSISMGKTPSLKKLSLHFLKIDIQGAAHSSVEDARATMLLFRLHRKDFERSIRTTQNRKPEKTA